MNIVETYPPYVDGTTTPYNGDYGVGNINTQGLVKYLGIFSEDAINSPKWIKFNKQQYSTTVIILHMDY